MKTGSFVGLGILAVLANLIFYATIIGGGVYFVFWCLQHFGVIGG